MKKLLALAFFAVLATSCSKKENTYQQDSNTMLSEPEVKVVDSAAVTEPVDNTTTELPVGDTATTPVDSAR